MARKTARKTDAQKTDNDEKDQPKCVLGLDMGSNSIGWALVDHNEGKIIASGSRIFPEGVDAFDTSKEKSRNETRRVARGMRRQITRRARRRDELKKALVAVGLFPADETEQTELLQTDPYELRAKGIAEKLEPYEIGRVFYHLNQRRGFLSNRRRDKVPVSETEETDDNKKSQPKKKSGDETQGMLEEISELQREIQESGAATLGEYLFNKSQTLDHADRTTGDFAGSDRIRNRHTHRSMLENEFELIWDVQAKHYPKILTEKLRYGKHKKDVGTKAMRKPIRKIGEYKGLTNLEAFGLHGVIFFQRKMYWPKSVIGLCEFEPKQKRCPLADRRAERFRVLQEVNNLKYIDPDAKAKEEKEVKLSAEQRTLLLDHLATRKEMTFNDIRKKFGFLDSVRFNFERGKRSVVKGFVIDHKTAAVFKDKKNWHGRAEDEKDTIIRLLIDNDRDEDAIAERLENEFGFTPQEADALLCLGYPDKYGSVSLMAIDKLLPHLEAGKILMANDDDDSALHAAGYLRRDQLQRRLFDQLPDPTRVSLADCRIGDLPNPVVKRALVELRKVVNNIIRTYGKPDAVHLETTREVRMGKKTRNEVTKKMQERKKVRDYAADEIEKYNQKYPDFSVRVNRASISRVLLWLEQNHECIYCQKSISAKQLFGGEVDVDHIFPYSRCLDDSQANKVVCHQKCNHSKGQQTPYEWLANTEEKRYEEMLKHGLSLVKKGDFPYNKYKKLMQKEIELDNFIARQLVDTGYIAKATCEYLKCLFEKEHAVFGLKGQLTATLRQHWGLNSILRDDELDKKSRDDHRHHAVDAIVIALTDRSRLQLLSKGGAFEEEFIDKKTGEKVCRKRFEKRLDDPWDGFRKDVEETIGNIKVSHRAERKVAGKLHEDSFYGRVQFIQKPLVDLTVADIDTIRDEAIQQLVKDYLKDVGLDIAGSKRINAKKLKGALTDLQTKLGETKMDVAVKPDKKHYVKRKPLVGLTANEIEKIRDEAIKQLVMEHLKAAGLEFGRGKKPDQKKMEQVLANVCMKSGVPVKKVRLISPEKTILPIREGRDDETFVKPGATHHLCIFEWEVKGKIKRNSIFVTQLEAINRIKRQQQELTKRKNGWKEEKLNRQQLKKRQKKAMQEIALEFPVIDRRPPKGHEKIPADAKFVMSLSNGEQVLSTRDEGEEGELLKLRTAISTDGRLMFANNTDAKREYTKITISPADYSCLRKITVDLLGRVRWAND